VIIWLNGTFGVGKTATAMELATIMPNARLFDAEVVGYLLMEILKDHEFSDFQELPPWRTLVPIVTAEIARFTGQHLLATQSVLNETYWKELRQGFSQHSLEVFHVVLHAEPEVLAHRIDADQEDQKARQWRLNHISDYLAARGWMEATADLVIDSTALAVSDVANSILQALQAPLRPSSPTGAQPPSGAVRSPAR
jgi:adenylylsulfate kinase-like enzyme